MLWTDLAKPLAEYVIMFINGAALKEFKELERSGHSEVSSSSEAASRDTIHGVEHDMQGNVTLPSGGKININEILGQMKTMKEQGLR